ncbi:MAG: CDP-alcohol phosphatidyltransferase family protein [Lentisphaerales bacterium]|nr:CDP-alcohol phosphatidyltransferase family protein [Lentisphaerales bacterium]
MNSDENRRPLKVRAAKIPTKIAKFLSTKNITPNQISIASIFFAMAAAICLVLLPRLPEQSALLAICSAVLIQGRLLCNLFDGMVAIEGGKRTPSGELFNDIPDRIADPLILIAMGYATHFHEFSVSLGWAAALLAVMTAYVRTLASSTGAPTNFGGPMAKQHRMAIATFACLLTVVEHFFMPAGSTLFYTLIIINIGCVITIANRTLAAHRFLEGNKA